MWGGITIAEVINHAKFQANRYIGFDFEIWVEISRFPMLSAMAYATGLGYRPTRD